MAATTLGEGIPSKGISSCLALSAKAVPRQNGWGLIAVSSTRSLNLSTRSIGHFSAGSRSLSGISLAHLALRAHIALIIMTVPGSNMSLARLPCEWTTFRSTKGKMLPKCRKKISVRTDRRSDRGRLVSASTSPSFGISSKEREVPWTVSEGFRAGCIVPPHDCVE
jgi:hypothetical protein